MAFAIEDIDFEAIQAREKKAGNSTSWVTLIIAFLISLIWIIPFYYLAITIFKTDVQYFQQTPFSLPSSFWPLIDNVKTAWVSANMGSGFYNSALYATVGASVGVFLSAMAAFALTRIDIGYKNFWFMLIFSGTIFPLQMFLIPLFFGYQKLGILNTQFGMLLFYVSVCVPFPTLVLRNFMNGISHEIDEAARMDGASEFRVFFSIILPNTWGPMVAMFLLQFTWVWNDLLFSTVLGNRVETRSIMNSLQVFTGNYAATGGNIILTAALVASLPSILLFIVLRRHFMEGMRISSG